MILTMLLLIMMIIIRMIMPLFLLITVIIFSVIFIIAAVLMPFIQFQVFFGSILQGSTGSFGSSEFVSALGLVLYLPLFLGQSFVSLPFPPSTSMSHLPLPRASVLNLVKIEFIKSDYKFTLLSRQIDPSDNKITILR